MLEIILLILKIIGFTLLGLLGLALLLVLAVLFVPVRYKAWGDKHEELKAEGRITWLLHILRIHTTYADGKLKTKGKLLFFNLLDSDEDVEEELSDDDDSLFPDDIDGEENLGSNDSADKDVSSKTSLADHKNEVKVSTENLSEADNADDVKEAEEAKQENVNRDSENKAEDDSVNGSAQTVNAGDKALDSTVSDVEIKEVPGADTERTEDRSENEPENGSENEPENGSENEPENNSETDSETDSETGEVNKSPAEPETESNPGHKAGKKKKRKKDSDESFEDEPKKQGIVKKVKNLYNIKNDPRAVEFYHVAKKRVIKIVKHILPRKLRGSIRFGTGDPCSTGKILGAAAMMYPIYGGHLSVEPVFEEKALEFDLYLRGRIRVITVLLPGLRTYWSKDFKYVRKKIKKAVK